MPIKTNNITFSVAEVVQGYGSDSVMLQAFNLPRPQRLESPLLGRTQF